ncbi:putative glycosyl transferase [bacterium YEK0313]|nr:putative glycosyl transferase [bacterium YEK0313]
MLRRTRDIVHCLQGCGAAVDWYVDQDDPLEDHGSIAIHRVLPAAGPDLATRSRPARGSFGAAVGDQATGSMHRRSGVKACRARLWRRRAPVARDVSTDQTSWLAAIERADRWARGTWHHAGAAMPTRLAALGLWVFVRCFYQVRWSVHTGGWYLGAMLRAGGRHVRWRIVHPAARRASDQARRFYWTLLFPRVVEPSVGAAQRLRWHIVHPIGQWVGRRARGFYWQVLVRRVAEPGGAAVRHVRWRFVHPVGQRAVSLAQWFYWHLVFRFVREPALAAMRYLRWRAVHPVGQRAASFGRWLYWQVLFRGMAEPVAAAARHLRWHVLHPVGQAIGRRARRLYWQTLFPHAVEPAAEAFRRTTRQVVRRLRHKRHGLSWRLFRRGRFALSLAGRGLRRAWPGSGPRRHSAGAPREDLPWIGMFAAAGADWRARGLPQVVLLPDAIPERLEALFDLVPCLGLDAPLDVPLIALFRPEDMRSNGMLAGCGSLRERWLVGAPFRTLHPLVIQGPADGGKRASVRGAAGGGLKATRMASAQDVARAILCIGGDPEGETPGRLACARFGPLAVVLSALWGRVGSTAIFETQAGVLMRRGYRVARVYVEHWPHRGLDRGQRLRALVGADQARQQAHLTLIMERNERLIPPRSLARTVGFKPASSVGRFAQALANCTLPDRVAAGYIASRAVVAVVNHAQHMAAARSLTAAPVILETHDVLTDLLDLHGIPAFVPGGRDSRSARLADERALWAQAACCVNLSAADHAEVLPFARQVALIRPCRPLSGATGRTWPDIVQAHGAAGWSANAAGCGNFDLMLWGSWHDNNVRSIRWFFLDVLPLLAGARRLRIVLAGAVVRAMGDLSFAACDLVTCPEVDALEDLAARASVLVIPDQGGTGISIKMMDALAWGACFAATPGAFRALDLTDEEHCWSATAAELAEDISRLLSSMRERTARSMTGRRIFARNYSVGRYEAAWGEVLDRLGFGGEVRGPSAGTGAAAAPRHPRGPLLNPMRTEARRGRPRLSVVVATCERYDVLPDTLGALQAQRAPASMEVIVVDHSPDTVAAARFRARYAGCPGLHFVADPALRLSEAREAGLRRAAGAIVAFIDDDMIAAPGWAKALIAAFQTDGDTVVAVVGPITTRWGRARPPWLPDEPLLDAVAIGAPGETREPAGQAWTSGCNLAVRREAIIEAGGVAGMHGREGSVPWHPQAELLRRLKRDGRCIVHAPNAAVEQVVHPERLSQDWFLRRAAWQAVSDAIGRGHRTSDGGGDAGGASPSRAGQRPGRALLPFRECGDPDSFAAEAGIAYATVAGLLAGGREEAGTRDAAVERSSWRLPDPVRARSAGRHVARRTVGELRLSVVVATYQRYRDLPRAIASLLAQDLARGSLDIIVVDNSPDAARARAFADRYAGIDGLTYLVEARPGLSNARNVGLERSRAPIVAFIDDDAVAAPDWARQIDRAFGLSDQRVAAVGGRVLPRFVSARPAWLADELMGYLSIIDWKGGLRELARHEWIAGCNMAFRRDRLVDAGGFPLQLGRNGHGHMLLSNDESAVVARLREQGHVAVYAPEACVEHVIDPARLDRAWFRRRAAWQAVSDCIQDDVRAAEHVAASMQHVRRAARSGLSPVLSGTFSPTVDPDVFRQEVALAYDMTLVALAGPVDGALDAPGRRIGLADIAGEARAHMLAHPRMARLGRRLRDSVVG